MTKRMPIVMVFALACSQPGIYTYERCTDLTSVPYADADWNAKGAEQIIDAFSAIEVPTQVVWDQRTLEGPSASLALTISASLDDALVIERQGAGCFIGPLLQVPIVVDITIGANEPWPVTRLGLDATDHDAGYTSVLWGGNTEVSAPGP